MSNVRTGKTITIAGRELPYCDTAVRIWGPEQAGVPYVAFTHLRRFEGQWYCAFREAQIHMVDRAGRVRIIRSSDGVQWSSVAVLSWPDGDVRDPRLSITPDGQFIVTCGVRLWPPEPCDIRSVTWSSRDESTWQMHQPDAVNTWRWDVAWHQGVGYSFGYSVEGPGRVTLRLYHTRNGIDWSTIPLTQQPTGLYTEAALLFEDSGQAHCLLRRDPAGEAASDDPLAMALWGTAQEPYEQWQWQPLPRRCAGPALIKLRDGRIVAGARLFGGGVPPFAEQSGYQRRFSLCTIDPHTRAMREALVFKAGGDGGTGYPGLVEHNGELWVSFYSGHEFDHEAAAIYLARIPLAALSG